MRKIYPSVVLFFFLLSISSLVFSQESIDKRSIELSFSIGCSLQFFAFEHFLQQPNIPRYDGSFTFGGGGNEDGFGVPIAFKVYDTHWGVGLAYEPTIRYDIVKPAGFFLVSGPPSKNVYGLFFDHHFSVYHKFSPTQFLFYKFKKAIPMYVGVGYSVISLNQSYDYSWKLYDKRTQTVTIGSKVDLSFNGIHALFGMQVYKRFSMETKFIHVPQNQIIYKMYQSTNMIIIKGAYQIPILERKKV